MGDQHTMFLSILASGGFGAVLGGGFGAVAGAITWTNGRPAGTYLGFRVARAFERAAERELTPSAKGAVIGGTDGSAFLGAVGVLVGALVALYTPQAWSILGPTALAVTLLVVAGALFGLAALVLLRSGVRAVVPLFCCAMVGAAIGLYLGHANGLFTGLVVGLAVGTIVAFLWGPRRS